MKWIKLIFLLFLVILLTSCGKASQNEEERFVDAIENNDTLNEYLSDFSIVDGDLDKEMGAYLYSVSGIASDNFLNLSDNQKYYILRLVSEEIEANISSNSKSNNGHLDCGGKTPCRFDEVQINYFGDNTDNTIFYSLDFTDFLTNTDEMEIFTIYNEEDKSSTIETVRDYNGENLNVKSKSTEVNLNNLDDFMKKENIKLSWKDIIEDKENNLGKTFAIVGTLQVYNYFDENFLEEEYLVAKLIPESSEKGEYWYMYFEKEEYENIIQDFGSRSLFVKIKAEIPQKTYEGGQEVNQAQVVEIEY
ncbi:hypothetical protein [Paraliobacillus sp. X-1268]|uniref:hypothetical protein n=1 Tax=Paraliobacillus sp. X-1268 TaxID=2213193 RepID=UPI000E3E82EB|nr:hypothetical protein [Paraliobacillus sp. X-1268]